MKVTIWLIIINVVLFFVFLILLGINPNLENYIFLKPSNLFSGYVWTLITSMFMHGSFLHIFVNMFSLFFIGSFLERIIGRKRFFWFYIISGIFAGLFFSALSYTSFPLSDRIFGTPEIYAVGASGAIFGLLGVLAVLVPRARVYLLAGPIVAIVAEAILEVFVSNQAVLSVVSMIVTIYIFVSIFTMFSINKSTRKLSVPVELSFWTLPFIAIIPLIIIGLFVFLPIANTAHLGGLIAGLIYGFYLRKKYQKKIKLLDKMVR